MRSYRSLEAWKAAHRALLLTQAECLALAAGEAGYLEQAMVDEMDMAFGDSMRILRGLMKGRRAKEVTPYVQRATP